LLSIHDGKPPTTRHVPKRVERIMRIPKKCRSPSQRTTSFMLRLLAAARRVSRGGKERGTKRAAPLNSPHTPAGREPVDPCTDSCSCIDASSSSGTISARGEARRGFVFQYVIHVSRPGALRPLWSSAVTEAFGQSALSLLTPHGGVAQGPGPPRRRHSELLFVQAAFPADSVNRVSSPNLDCSPTIQFPSRQSSYVGD
jgi:hypothetical protein